MKGYLILVINPGSTSTKIAVFRDEKSEYAETLRHNTSDLARFSSVIDQFDYRKQIIKEAIKRAGFDIEQLNAVVGRGGLLKPISGGTYKISAEMISDLKKEARGSHASNLGAILTQSIAAERGIPAYIVDPVCVDEMKPIARISGMPENPRESLFHALNQKAIARRAAEELGKRYEEINLIVAHLGGGISVGAHQKGRVIDVNNAVGGEGPFSPERSGGVPVAAVVDMCFSGKYSRDEMIKKLVGRGGLVAYLGTIDAVEVENRIKEGDNEAKLIYEAMAYQVAKEIGAYSTVLKGDVTAIVITGGIAHSRLLVEWIKARVNFIAPVRVYPGEDEMEALAKGVIRVLSGKEDAKVY